MPNKSSPPSGGHEERGMTRQSTGAGPLWVGPELYDGRDLHYDLEHHVTSREERDYGSRLRRSDEWDRF